MAEVPALDRESAVAADGRRLRRERNVQAVLDAVLEMFSEDMVGATIEKASERTGLSLRSLYRYFPDQESLVGAAIEEAWRRGAPIAHLHDIGEGPFAARLTTFVAMRLRLYAVMGASFRATVHYAPLNLQVRTELERTRRELTVQFERQFRREIDALPADQRKARSSSADVMSQLDTIDLLRTSRRLTVRETTELIEATITMALVAG